VRRTRLPLIPVFALFVGGALLRLHFVVQRHGPVVFADEVAPLLFARAITGVGAHPTMGIDSPYHLGYSVLLAIPTLWFGPESLFRTATVVNTLLLATSTPLLFFILRDSLGVERRVALAAASVASLYPAFLLEPGFSWSESAVLTSVLLTYFACQRMVRSPTLGCALAFGASTAAAYAIHPRLIPILALAPIALYLSYRWHGLRARHATLAAAATIALFLTIRIGNRALSSAIYVATRNRDEGSVLAELLADPAMALGALASLAGQLWYLAVATIGLAPLGIVYLLRQVKRSPRRVDLLWILSASVTCLLVTSLFLADPGRVDHRIYGRYAETIVAVPLAAGVVSLALRRSVLDKLGAMLLVPGLLTGTLLLVIGTDKFQGLLNPLNILAIEQFHELGSRIRIDRVSLAMIVAAAVLITARCVLRRGGAVLALSAVVGFFLWSTFHIQEHVIDRVDRTFQAVPSVPDTIPLIEKAAGLTIDRIDVLYEPGSHRTSLLRYQVASPRVEFDITSAPLPRGPWVLARSSWPAGEAAGARLVVPDGVRLALWVMPGPEQDRLKHEQMLSGNDPLIADDLRSRITSAASWMSVQAGESSTIELRVKNLGRRPWPSFSERAVAGEPIFLRARWHHADSAETVRWDMQLLTRRIYPRNTIDVAFEFGTQLDDGSTVLPGLYRVTFELIQHRQDFAVAAVGPPISVEVR
jgi:hypothetical protein